jgi:hypothetical protein
MISGRNEWNDTSKIGPTDHFPSRQMAHIHRHWLPLTPVAIGLMVKV